MDGWMDGMLEQKLLTILLNFFVVVRDTSVALRRPMLCHCWLRHSKEFKPVFLQVALLSQRGRAMLRVCQ